MAPSIAPSFNTNNVRTRNRRPQAKGSASSNLDRQLDAAIAQANALATWIAAGIRDLLFDELDNVVHLAARHRWSAAELAHAIACASARSARLTVYVMANPPELSDGSSVATAVRQVLRPPLPNQGGYVVDAAAELYVAADSQGGGNSVGRQP